MWSWVLRFVHIALDTLVLYGVLQETGMDERADRNLSSSSVIPEASAGPPVGLHKSVAPEISPEI